jgi:hypothetical protein
VRVQGQWSMLQRSVLSAIAKILLRFLTLIGRKGGWIMVVGILGLTIDGDKIG